MAGVIRNMAAIGAVESSGGGGGGGGESDIFKLTWNYGAVPATNETAEDVVNAMAAGKLVIDTFNPQYYDPDFPQQLMHTGIISTWWYDAYDEDYEYLFYTDFADCNGEPKYHAATLADHLTLFGF